MDPDSGNNFCAFTQSTCDADSDCQTGEACEFLEADIYGQCVSAISDSGCTDSSECTASAAVGAAGIRAR